ncbi:MAG: type II secretion system GspH family protein [Gammaproteobacteria bacterium]|nr:type II secretion system GspH family protein [Gammaproteobacteria bacterium]
MSGFVRGFTLVELITVMMILGILSLGTVKFIGDSSQGFASTISRSELATDARFVVERLARDVRDALPNSVRVSGGCLEFVPVVGASSYTTLPVTSAAISFLSVPVDPLPLPAGARAAVFPDLNVYALGSPATVSPTVALSAPDAGNEVTVTMAAAHRFGSESPSNRYFLVTDPVSYCVDNARVWRYSGYGFVAAQPGPGGLPAAMPGRALVTQNVTTLAPFTLADATLSRNAVVGIDLEFTRGGDAVRIEHMVQIRNVP